MITKDQVKTTFSKCLNNTFGFDLIEIGNSQFVTPDDFVTQFPVNNLIFDQLMAVDPQNNKGYNDFFNRCHADGII